MDKEPSPYPWPAIITTLVVAVAVYGLGLIYSVERVREARSQSIALQRARSQQMALQLDGYFGLAAQLTDVAAATIDPQNAPYGIEQTLRQLLSASGSRVQAAGAYYSQGYPGPIRVVRSSPSTRPLAGDYARRAWFTAALAAPGKAVFSRADPPSGAPFVAVSESLGSKNPSGVAMIETSHTKLDSLLARSNDRMDSTWITDTAGNVIAGTTPPPDMAVDAALKVPLGSAPWTLQIASHFADVDDAQRNALAIDLPLTIIAWGGALLTIFALLRVHKLQLRQAALQKSAARDALTGLYNRAHVLWRLKEALDRSR